MAWPARSHASARIIKYARKFDGNNYEWLTELARTLDDKWTCPDKVESDLGFIRASPPLIDAHPRKFGEWDLV
jgi:hypothetical protein